MSPSTTSRVTTDPDVIRRWAEQRGAKPASRSSGDDNAAVIGLNCPGDKADGTVQEISWDEWLRKFDEHRLALLYQEEMAAGDLSMFNQIIMRETVDEVEGAVGGRGRSARRKEAPAKKKAAGAGVTSERSATLE